MTDPHGPTIYLYSDYRITLDFYSFFSFFKFLRGLTMRIIASFADSQRAFWIIHNNHVSWRGNVLSGLWIEDFYMEYQWGPGFIKWTLEERGLRWIAVGTVLSFVPKSLWLTRSVYRSCFPFDADVVPAGIPAHGAWPNWDTWQSTHH